MVSEIRFSNEAHIEFYKAKCFMGLNGKENEFWKNVEHQLEYILKFPEAFQIRYRTIRIVSLENFNYSIHYIPKPYGILVYRFLNQNQDF